ncbi:Ribosomal RNA small subunit methyltransferase D [Microbacterium sp. C448]|uniref:16S rRNA (guanine(966)-N(2))-methyltransferase RsmD n=1 Tax=Microbacterium TaxID=33882 RepID=UPI0003DE6DFE|nr:MULTISPECIES: 16S rRNA (guanine(966)-N(2))-methyltransferase RsmD [Microbacterium]CDK01192.1 Ribosomal RNA small subunit methyltransferase D [Microbacterium sp. C448]
MTRIIAGDARGIRLAVPARGTRPTSDRVRESLFAGMESAGALDDARVLDLYAGSGALGLEALSRGAASVDLVELSRPAAAIARENIGRVERSLGRTGLGRVHTIAADAYLRGPVGPFDLVFLDPPYELGESELTATLSLLAPHLAEDGLVVVERSRHSPEPGWPAGLALARERTYGDTVIWQAH